MQTRNSGATTQPLHGMRERIAGQALTFRTNEQRVLSIGSKSLPQIEVLSERPMCRWRERDQAVLLALALTNDQLIVGPGNVADIEAAQFAGAQARVIEQRHDRVHAASEERPGIEFGKETLNLGNG